MLITRIEAPLNNLAIVATEWIIIHIKTSIENNGECIIGLSGGMDKILFKILK